MQTKPYEYLWNLDYWENDRAASEYVQGGNVYVCDKSLANSAYTQGYQYGESGWDYLNKWNHPALKAAFELGYKDGGGDRASKLKQEDPWAWL